ncbi:hypothetical protein [Acidianus two-tailed virus 2]|nr:hypothetical protein [Acidianus two-tailed virus 2]
MGVWYVVLYLLNTLIVPFRDLIVPFRDERAKFEIERVSVEEAKEMTPSKVISFFYRLFFSDLK